MNIKVQLDGVKVYNDAKVLTGVKIRSGGDLEIKARNLEVTDKAEVLTDMEIEEVLKRAESALQELEPCTPEYSSLSRIVQAGNLENRTEFMKKIGKHKYFCRRYPAEYYFRCHQREDNVKGREALWSTVRVV